MDGSAKTTGLFAFGLKTNKKVPLPYSALFEIIQTQNENNTGIYEWIENNIAKVRMYIDIDINIENEETLSNAEQQYSNAITIINEYFVGVSWNIAKSITDKKLSAHMISNSHFSNMKTLKPIIELLNKQNKYIDIIPYSTGTQKFRLPLSVKDGDGRPLSIAPETELIDYILGNTDGLIEYIPPAKKTMNDNLKKALDNVPSEYWGNSWGEKPINWHNLKQIIYNIMPNEDGFKLLDTYSIGHNGYDIEKNQTIWNNTKINAKYYNLQWLDKRLKKEHSQEGQTVTRPTTAYDTEYIADYVVKKYSNDIIIEVDTANLTNENIEFLLKVPFVLKQNTQIGGFKFDIFNIYIKNYNQYQNTLIKVN